MFPMQKICAIIDDQLSWAEFCLEVGLLFDELAASTRSICPSTTRTTSEGDKKRLHDTIVNL